MAAILNPHFRDYERYGELRSFLRMQNPGSTVANASFTSKVKYIEDKITEVGLPFYTDYISEESYVRLIFALRASDLDDRGVINPAPALERNIHLVFTIAAKTFDGYAWGIKYRLTLTNKKVVAGSSQADRDKYSNRNGFRIDSHKNEAGGLMAHRLNLNGYTRVITKPNGTTTTQSYLTCYNDDPINQPKLYEQFVDIQINRDQFYLFDLFLSGDDTSSHFGLNGMQTTSVFRETDLQLFSVNPTVGTVPGEITFKCEFENMPVKNGQTMLTLDISSIWLALAGKDTNSIRMWDIFDKFFNKGTGAVVDMGPGVIDEIATIFRPIFYINAVNGLVNEIDKEQLVIAGPTDSIRRYELGVNIYNPTITTYDTHIVIDSSPTMNEKVYDSYVDSWTKIVWVPLEKENINSAAIFVSAWAKGNITLTFCDDKTSDKMYYNVVHYSKYNNIFVQWGSASNSAKRYIAEYKGPFIGTEDWAHITFYGDIDGNFSASYNSDTNFVKNASPSISFLNAYLYANKITTAIEFIVDEHSLFPLAGDVNEPSAILYPIIYMKNSHDGRYKWNLARDMISYFRNSAARPIYPGIDGFRALDIMPDIFYNGVNGLGVFGNAAHDALCCGTPRYDTTVGRSGWASLPISCVPMNVEMGRFPPLLIDVYTPTLLDIANEALTSLGRPAVRSIEINNDKEFEEAPLEIQQITLALPRVILSASTRDFGFNRFTLFVTKAQREDKKPYDYGIDSRYVYYGEIPPGIATILEIRTKSGQLITQQTTAGRDLWVNSHDDELSLVILKEINYKNPDFMDLLAKDKDVWVKFAAGELASRIAGPINATQGGAQISANNELYRMSEQNSRSSLPNSLPKGKIDYRGKR